MLPVFPIFKKLDLGDRDVIEKYYFGEFLPSDYHFASLWGWDLNNDLEITDLNKNLVVKFKDYQNSETFLSFFGKNELENTINSIFDYCEKNNYPAKISLLPEQNFSSIDLSQLSAKFSVTADEDNYDYIFSVKDLLTYDGKDLYEKKKQLNKFKLNYANKTDITILESINEETYKDILLLVQKWSAGKLEKKDINNIEIEALKKSLFAVRNLKFYIFCLYIEKKLTGVSVYEVIGNQAIHSFQKAELSYTGITEFINHKIAEQLDKMGVSYINAEQDLGIEGLRRAKRAYNPKFLKKYTVSKLSAN